MSLDNIQLVPFLVQQLYKKSLVELDSINKESIIANNVTIPFLGKNERNILVVVKEADAVFLPDADLNLLIRILSACKLSLADIALINFDKNAAVDYTILMKEFTPELILLFGINPGELQFPLHFPNYQLQQYNHQTYISSASFNILNKNKEEKTKLWDCLQKHFFND